MVDSQLTSAAESGRVADTVYAGLRDAIFTGDLRPGGRLSVPALADRLGVSRSPVREAVQRLIAERLAVEEPRRGAVVARIDTAELVRLYEVREVLEGLATRLAVEHSGRRLVDRLATVLDEHTRAVADADIAAHMDADQRFHRLLRLGSDNAEVVRMLDSIQARVQLAMRTTSVTAGPRLALADHRAIYEAVRAGDPTAAEERARAHVARLRASFADDLTGGA